MLPPHLCQPCAAFWAVLLSFTERINKENDSLVVRYPPRAKRSDSSCTQDSDDDDEVYDSSRKLFHRVMYLSSEAADTLQLAWATTVHKVGAGCKV